MADQTQMIVFCAGCGEAVVLNVSDGPSTTVREPESAEPGAEPGRVTISLGGADGTVVHQCAPGTYLPPDQKAPPRGM